MIEFDSIEEELKFMADCSDDRGDSETSLMFVRYLAHIRKLNSELAALKAGQGHGEAVEVVAYLPVSNAKALNSRGITVVYCGAPSIEDAHELMTVAQHESIVAAITAKKESE